MRNYITDITGNASHTVPEDPYVLRDLSIPELMSFGLTKLQAKKAYQAIQLSKVIAEPPIRYSPRITSPVYAKEYCLSQFPDLRFHGKQEEFWCITLDTKNQPIAKHQITIGTLRNSLVHPREVFRPAIKDAANCIIVMHNHPSGDTTPSDQDISVTERLEAASEVIGITVIDHIIIGAQGACSLQEWRTGMR